MNFREEYKTGVDKIRFDENFNTKTAKLIQEKTADKITYSRKPFRIFVAAAAIFVLLTTSVFAASVFLTPDKVAERFGENSIAELFRSKNVISVNESIIDSRYCITLHGIAEGTRLAYIEDVAVREDRSYIVLSIESLDGTELNILDNEIHFTPLVKGYEPLRVNAGTLECEAMGFAENGVIYCLFDSTNLKLFADNTVYIAAYEGMIPGSFDMKDKDISYDSSYDGVKAIFELPLNPDDADSEAVNNLLSPYNV